MIKNYPTNVSEDVAEKFCDCKIENFKKKILNFVSKLN